MTDKKTRSELYAELKEDINKRDLSNSESFDKAILSLSSAGLAISLSFIKFMFLLKMPFIFYACILRGFALAYPLSARFFL